MWRQGLDVPRFGDLPLPVQQNRKAQLHACEKTADAIIGLTDGHDENRKICSATAFDQTLQRG